MTSPPLAQETDFGRKYVNFRTGEAVPSITTCMKMIAKPEVEDWKIRMTADHANGHWEEMAQWSPADRKAAMTGAHGAYTNEKAALGTLIHGICDSWMKGIPAETPKAASPYMTQFSRFLMDRRPVFAETEVTVWSRTLRYAGTADAVAEIDGRVTLIDIKTGRGIYGEHGLQLSALKNADFIIRDDCTEEPIPEIDQLAVLHLRPRSCRLVLIRREEECFRAFRAARELFHWRFEVADDVLGEAA